MGAKFHFALNKARFSLITRGRISHAETVFRQRKAVKTDKENNRGNGLRLELAHTCAHITASWWLIFVCKQ